MSKQDGTGRRVTVAPVDDRSASILHVDMDAFFASVELLERPDLVGKPVIVGHPSARSVVTAATYEARRFGVNSAMPMAVALRRCPQAIVLEPHFERYQHFSAITREIFAEFTPLVEPLSIDEAFLDVRGAFGLFGGPFELGTELRRRVHERTGLRCSVGLASTKFVAKLASTRAKPDGLLVIGDDETLDFLHPQPISALWGVGAKTEEQLRRLGIGTIGDLAHASESALRAALGATAASRLQSLARGEDPRRVTPDIAERSLGHEVTFERDVADPAELDRELLRLSIRVGERLRRSRAQARTISIKVRYGDFTTITRSRTLGEPTAVGRRIAEEAIALRRALGEHPPVRLLGVRAEQLSTGEEASSVLWDDDEPWREAEQAVDALSRRFGSGVVQPASLVHRRPAPQRPPE